MELLRLKCPACHSSDIKYHSPYTTKNHGGRVIYKCENCPTYFSETKNTLLEGLKTPVSVIWQVIKARTDGLGLHAATRTFDKAKHTILAWERKFADSTGFSGKIQPIDIVDFILWLVLRPRVVYQREIKG